MKVGIMQPYFLPYIGYFQLIKAVDKYVVYDDVNYIKRGWINRNNILVNNQKQLFTISLKDASQNKLINEIQIEDDFKKFSKTVQMNYRKAPYFEEGLALLNRITNYPNKQLALFITNSINEVLQYLQINTEIILSSSIQKNCSLKGEDKILDICIHIEASTYINAIGGQELYNREEFRIKGIDLYFLNPQIKPYSQFKNEFVSHLSILDVIMFNSVEEINSLLDNYTLI